MSPSKIQDFGVQCQYMPNLEPIMDNSQTYIPRNIDVAIQQTLARKKSILLLGPRQTGKTTLVNHLESDISISLIQPAVRNHYEREPSSLAEEIEAKYEIENKKPLIVIDEVQLVPELLDVAQDLIDRDIAQFVLTGSSARQLRKAAHMNLLPGRIVYFRLAPFSLSEIPHEDSIEDLLYYGSLPGIVNTESHEMKGVDLQSYVEVYLEEIRAEAVVRNVASFGRFLELAASESGNLVSMRKLSEEIGVAHTTISSYYQILEDCLVVEKVEPLIKTKVRRKLSKSPKYLFFDLGVRRLAAKSGVSLPEKYLGQLFEQFVGLELIRQCQQQTGVRRLYYWRDTKGPEVDWVLEVEGKYIPIEVKWTASPKEKDARHLQTFLQEYDNCERAYVVCRVPRARKLGENIYAIPWQALRDSSLLS